MDELDILKSSGLSVGTIAFLYGLIQIIKKLNNKRIHSKCNGKDILDVVIDVNEATEKDKTPTPKPSPTIKPQVPEHEPEKLNYIV
jgi:hypothetical protein